LFGFLFGDIEYYLKAKRAQQGVHRTRAGVAHPAGSQRLWRFLRFGFFRQIRPRPVTQTVETVEKGANLP
jgi:hypothetical protein